MLREGLLSGRTVALTGGATDLSGVLEERGAEIRAAPGAGMTALIHDCAESFAQDGLMAALAETWSAVCAAANTALIPGRGGKIVLIAPDDGAGPLAGAARAGIENLARTLSVEWARHTVTVTAVLPGRSTSREEVSTLVAFLLSRAGDYFSGCRFELDSI